jgi:hypothetical protein
MREGKLENPVFSRTRRDGGSPSEQLFFSKSPSRHAGAYAKQPCPTKPTRLAEARLRTFLRTPT